MLTMLPKVPLSTSVLNSQIGQSCLKSTTPQAGLSRMAARLSLHPKDTVALFCEAIPTIKTVTENFFSALLVLPDLVTDLDNGVAYSAGIIIINKTTNDNDDNDNNK